MKGVVATALTATVLVVGGCTQVAEKTGSPSASTAETSHNFDDTTAQRLDDVINDTAAKAAVPGVIVGVWGPQGDYVHTFGIANKSDHTPMRADFYQRIASETKTFVVTAVLQLADQGKLGLDDPVGKYVDGVPNGDKITLRQLARMQSGLVNYSMSAAFNRDFQADPHRTFTDRQLLDYAFAEPAAFPPGQGFQYSNTNAVLLGLVVVKAGGQSLPDYIHDHIAGPLGLNHTSFPTTSALPDPHAHGYTKQTPDGAEQDCTDWSPSWASAAGAMISTLGDLRIWAQAVASGALLKPQTQQERLQGVAMPPLPDDIRYGLGIFDARGWIGHNGSIPGYQTLVIYSPAKKTTVVVFVNTDISNQNVHPSTLFGTVITKVIAPDEVFALENAT